ncbi:uncharacterized protein LOC115835086 [Nomascus leucogenys]|uniref:uncharacterized protein LOC115835086 n=1 Tax=Nomascus leucogenys TaxID=61853 RepID=UPI00122DC227|nr:uncharacterized protein LOC115835086 [Nomascus leucogenys]
MGGIFVRYLKQSRENKAGLCAARRPGSWEPPAPEHCAGRGECACARRPGSSGSGPAFTPAELPGGHKKAKGFLCDIILARSSLTNLDLQVSMATAAGHHWHQIVSLKGHTAARADKQFRGNSHVAISFLNVGWLVRMM